jgi:hypothetical protein
MATKFLAAAVLLGLLGCPNETAITRITRAQNKPVSDNSAPMVEPQVESPVKPIGHFTNVKSKGEHQWGYEVELWRQDDKIYGLISGSSHSRLVGDPPTGLLEDVKFDPKTGKLSFRAKLPGVIFAGNELPGEVYEFEGV